MCAQEREQEFEEEAASYDEGVAGKGDTHVDCISPVGYASAGRRRWAVGSQDASYEEEDTHASYGEGDGMGTASSHDWACRWAHRLGE